MYKKNKVYLSKAFYTYNKSCVRILYKNVTCKTLDEHKYTCATLTGKILHPFRTFDGKKKPIVFEISRKCSRHY